ncbi:hypothetical protein Kpho02_76270 [Kitasatospora phosalacinea]|uniref:Conjugal transfer protein n=1 Tax=Kitasatospora phosalacinea TaxID=2065 RepID=A0A9W6QDR8_9ACTN|nr:hypothetical protein [Kitasatospora phosalacinea]GLW75330.1 hypothetical protein Kpho02_76270 [Kitasatospora phosalacinea]
MSHTKYELASADADTAPVRPGRRRRTDAPAPNRPEGGRLVSKGATVVLAVIFAAMAAVGGAGAYSTYHNMKAVLGDGSTALGVVAAGEGATGVLGLTLIGLTLITRPYPLPLRLSLWLIPAIGSGVGVYLAADDVHRVIYGVTPLAMTVAAELAGYLARSVIVHRTGRDAEADRRTGELLRMVEFHQARALNHPDEKTRVKSEKKAWALAERLGKGDPRLTTALTQSHAERTTEAALVALDRLYGRTDTPAASTDTPAAAIDTAPAEELPALPSPLRPAPAELPAPEPEPVTDTVPVETASPWWTQPTQEPTHSASVYAEPFPEEEPEPACEVEQPSTQVPGHHPFATFDTADTDTDTVTDETDTAVPEPGERMTDVELDAVVHMIRTETNPPRSLRAMEERFRELGYIASAARLRASWDRVTLATAGLDG